MPRPDRCHLLGLRERVQPLQRAQVGTEPAVGVRHDRGAPAEHGVPGQHRALRGQHEGQRVRGVTRGGHDLHLQPVDLHHVAVAEALRAEPVGGVEGTHPAAHPLREGAGRLGVVGVPVREQHDRDLPRGVRDRVEVRGVLGPGVDHDAAPGPRLAQHPGVGAVEGHDVRVRREHAAGALAEGPRPSSRLGPGHPRADLLAEGDQPVGDGQVGVVAVELPRSARPAPGPAVPRTPAPRPGWWRRRAPGRCSTSAAASACPRRRPRRSPRAPGARSPRRTRWTRRG